MTRIMPIAATLAAVALTLAGCAQPVGPGADPDAVTAVIGQGTVIQKADATPQLCLRAVAVSSPPQCTGPEVLGWDWSSVEGQETAGDVTWGTYAVWGDWDGTSLTVTSQIQLALYDPMPVVDPALDPANTGSTPETKLEAISRVISAEAPAEVLASWAENGYLFVSVVFDDGSVQRWADSRFGDDMVKVRPALRLAEEVAD